MSFSSLNLHEAVQRALANAGYTEPTPVQAEAVPAALEGHDLIVSAQTGTGKTAAFMLPALSKIADDPRKPGRGPRILVLTPTRELAQQVTAATQKYGSELKGLRTVSVLGGMPFPAQNRLLSRPYDILVATPGRLLDHMGRGRIVFERLDMLVLDEADRMLDMGFIDDVEQIAGACPADRQTLMFSATVEDRMEQLARNLLKEPKRIAIAGHTVKHEQIEQRVYFADDLEHKKKLLLNLITQQDVNQAIVFAATRVDSDALADELAEMGVAVDSLHGDMKQSSRNRTLTALRSGRTKVLVATDVAARGIDVPGISLVVNYDLPKNAEDYVHRIGRTGRAGRTGTACSLVTSRDRGTLRRIEQFTQQQLDISVIEGLEPQRRFDERPRKKFGDKPRWGNKDRQQRDDRNKRFADRQPREDRAHSHGDRPFRGPRPDIAASGFNRFGGDEGRSNRAPRERRESINYDEQQPRFNGNESSEYQRRDFMERTGLDRKPRSSGFAGANRKPRDGQARSFGDRPARDGQPRSFGDRPARDGQSRPFGDRQPRDGGFKSPRQDGRARSFGDRPSHEGSYDGRPRRSAGDRPPVHIERKGRRHGGDFNARGDDFGNR